MPELRKKNRQGRHFRNVFKREAVNLLTSTPAFAAEISTWLAISVDTLYRRTGC